MPRPALIDATTRWECLDCGTSDETWHTPAGIEAGEPVARTRMHTCRAHGGMAWPMVVAGRRCHVRVNTREDYVGDSTVTYDPTSGRPVMALRVEDDDREDVLVFADCARGGGSSREGKGGHRWLTPTALR